MVIAKPYYHTIYMVNHIKNTIFMESQQLLPFLHGMVNYYHTICNPN